MDKNLCYIEYKRSYNCNILKKIWNKLFFNIKIQIIDKNKFYLLINRNKLNNNSVTKLLKYFKKNKIKLLVISSNIMFNYYDFEIQNVKILNGKLLMKNLIIQIIKYIFKCQNKDFRFENIYITTSNDNEEDLILDLANTFKSINIVTDKIKSLKRLGKKLDEDEDIIFSLSNNNKKALKRAKIIVNLNYDTNFFYKFNINRDAIIINLTLEKLEMKNSYQGLVVDNIIVKYNKQDESNIINKYNFNNTILYESYIYNFDYYKIKQNVIFDQCKVCNLIGSNGKISKEDIKKFQ